MTEHFIRSTGFLTVQGNGLRINSGLNTASRSLFILWFLFLRSQFPFSFYVYFELNFSRHRKSKNLRNAPQLHCVEVSLSKCCAFNNRVHKSQDQKYWDILNSWQLQRNRGKDESSGYLCMYRIVASWRRIVYLSTVTSQCIPEHSDVIDLLHYFQRYISQLEDTPTASEICL